LFGVVFGREPRIFDKSSLICYNIGIKTEVIYMTFRKADKSDILRISEIYSAVIDADTEPGSRIGWIKGVYPVAATAKAALLREDLFVCEREGRVIAAAIINKIQVDVYADCNWEYEASPEEVLILHTLVVDPDEYKKGVGSAFVACYEKMARDMGCTVLRMDTNERNNKARRLYKRLGYREAGIVPCVFNGIPDVMLVCLEKKL